MTKKRDSSNKAIMKDLQQLEDELIVANIGIRLFALISMKPRTLFEVKSDIMSDIELLRQELAWRKALNVEL